MTSVAEAFITLRPDLKGFADETEKGVSGITSKLGSALKPAAIGAALAVTGIGIAAVKMAADFDKGMREVGTLINASEGQINSLKGQVLDLSKQMGVGAPEAVKALYQAISAGVPADNAVDFLRVATKASIAGVTDLETAVDGITTALNAYQLPATEAEHVSDVLFAAVKAGKTTFDEMSTSLFNVAPLASAAGVSLEETAAAMAALTTAGTPTSVAATQVRAAIQGLLKPSTDVIDVFKKAGFASGQAAIEQVGLAGAMNILKDAAKGDIGALTTLVGSVEGVQAILSLTGAQAEIYNKTLDTMYNETGITQKAFDAMNKSASRQWQILKNQLNVAMIQLGEKILPVLTQAMRKAIPIIGSVLGFISKLPAPVLAVAGGAVVLVGAIAALLPVLGFLAPAIGLLLSPIGLVILAIAGLALAFATDFLGIRSFIVPIIESIIGWFKTLVLAFQGKPISLALWDDFRGAADVGYKFREIFDEIVNRFKVLVAGFLGKPITLALSEEYQGVYLIGFQIGQVFDDIVNRFHALIAGFLGKPISQALSDDYQDIYLFGYQARQVFDEIMTVVGAVIGFIVAHWPEISAAIGAGVDYVVGVVSNLIQVIGSIIEIVTSVVNLVSDLFHGRWAQAWGEMKDIAGAVIDGLLAELRLQFGSIPDIIIEQVGAAISAGERLAQGIYDGVVRILSGLPNKMAQIGRDAANAFLNSISVAGVSANDVIGFVGGLAGRAIGGAVTAGSPYIVGEKGPELFLPGVSGMVVSNHDLEALLSRQSAPASPSSAGRAAAGKGIHIEIHGDVIARDREDAERGAGDMAYGLMLAVGRRGFAL